ncbi:hypothetical protein [Ottowia sp.]|uniref:hypothetical protein n=1 Tax=Ottowia sp. TaxID=1898956 RepID=UPI003A87F560
MSIIKSTFIVATLWAAAGSAQAALSAVNTDDVLPNSPYKDIGMPDAGEFNPTGGGADAQRQMAAEPFIPAATTYYPPATVIDERQVKPYALVAAPTLPCAPVYCPRAVRVRADRN